ncbi:MAG: hypothetical protein ACJ788_02890 [Ktedonobacteraceae bacterium]
MVEAGEMVEVWFVVAEASSAYTNDNQKYAISGLAGDFHFYYSGSPVSNPQRLRRFANLL